MSDAADPPPYALPHTRFETTQPDGAERFEQWRSSISVIFDVAPVAGQDLDAFSATVSATHLGNLLVGDIGFGAQQFSRSQPRVARDGVDHYLVQWYREGGFVGRADDREIEVNGGDIVVFDLTRTQETWARPSQVLSFVLPRQLVQGSMPDADDLHGRVLKKGEVFADLLSDHFASLLRRLPGVPMDSAPAVAHATTQMIAACLAPGVRTLAEARAEMRGVTLERIQQYIARNLGSALDPQGLCQVFGISRTLLYELFEPLGGVARYILHRRLQRAFHALANPANRRLRVGEIASRVGFASESHFSRAFRSAFGMTPSDIRGASAGGGSPSFLVGERLVPSAEYAAWVLGLQGA